MKLIRRDFINLQEVEFLEYASRDGRVKKITTSVRLFFIPRPTLKWSFRWQGSNEEILSSGNLLLTRVSQCVWEAKLRKIAFANQTL